MSVEITVGDVKLLKGAIQTGTHKIVIKDSSLGEMVMAVMGIAAAVFAAAIAIVGAVIALALITGGVGGMPGAAAGGLSLTALVGSAAASALMGLAWNFSGVTEIVQMREKYDAIKQPDGTVWLIRKPT